MHELRGCHPVKVYSIVRRTIIEIFDILTTCAAVKQQLTEGKGKQEENEAVRAAARVWTGVGSWRASGPDWVLWGSRYELFIA